ncbi:MAG: hypothetical protein NTZ85_01620 [Bacteroidia bacterium]|nr:hypothetical protein [Bacteroidia bacterium]
MITWYQIGECIILAIVAWTYTIILTDSGMILEGWKRWINDNIKQEWITSPLINCEYCVSGQLALWYYLITYFQTYNLWQHIVFICITIFTIEIINYGLKAH